MTALFPTQKHIGKEYLPIWTLPDGDYLRITVWANSTWHDCYRRNGEYINRYDLDLRMHPTYYYVGDIRK